MTLIEFKQDPIFKSLLRNGFISPKINSYIEMYLYYQSKILTGTEKALAITWTSDNFGVSETTIYGVIKKTEALKLVIQEQ